MNYIQTYLALINGFKLTTMGILIGLDVVLGIVVAITTKTFDIHKIADYCDTCVLKLVGGYLLVGVLATAEPVFALAVTGTWGIIEIKLIADIIAKLRKLGVNVQQPTGRAKA